MKILDDLLATIKQEAVVKDIRQGPFQTAVLTNHCGLASTLRDYGHHQDYAPVKEAGGLIGKEALEIAEMAYSSSLLEAAIGMATINSLLDIDQGHCLSLNASEGQGQEDSPYRALPLYTETPPDGKRALGDGATSAGRGLC